MNLNSPYPVIAGNPIPAVVIAGGSTLTARQFANLRSGFNANAFAERGLLRVAAAKATCIARITYEECETDVADVKGRRVSEYHKFVEPRAFDENGFVDLSGD